MFVLTLDHMFIGASFLLVLKSVRFPIVFLINCVAHLQTTTCHDSYFLT